MRNLNPFASEKTVSPVILDNEVYTENGGYNSNGNYNDDGVDNRGSPFEPPVGELLPGEAEAGGLGRHLGLWSTTFLIIGRIIGTGIFSTPSSITKSVGSVGAAMLVWLLGAFISFAGLGIWLELGCMIPRSGGEKVYLEAAYKRPKLLATVVFAFQIIILGFTASACIVFTEYVRSTLPFPFMKDMEIWICANDEKK
jgi:hypothetical protein